MNEQDYYTVLWHVIRNSFEKHARFFIGTHKPDLLARGWNPHTHPMVEVIELPEYIYEDSVLFDRTCNRGYEIFLPIVGRENRTVLAPFDFEIYLEIANHRLYTEPLFQRNVLLSHIKPLSDIVEEVLMEEGIPYLIDYTPSGFHCLFLVQRGALEWEALKSIGYLENEMVQFIRTIVPDDVKRKDPVDFDAASVFSGIGRLADYLSLLTVTRYNRKRPSIPAAICDSMPYCVNVDQSWAGDSAIMRCMRAPASLHRKNNDRYGINRAPLTDVLFSSFDGRKRSSLRNGVVSEASPEETNLENIVEGMWNFKVGASISAQYSGRIPFANRNMVRWIERYRDSSLFLFHREFDEKEDLPEGAGAYRLYQDSRLSQDSRNMLYHPVPTFLQPSSLRRFVKDCLACGWHPKHVGNGIRDIYRQNPFHFSFEKYPAETKANFYARVYSALALVEAGKMEIV